MTYFICEKQGRCCQHEFYDSIEQAIADSEDGVPCDHLIEVSPVRHGRWEPVIEGVWNLPTPVLVGWRCSQCGRTEQEKEPYCNCGAKMDLEE